MLKFYTPSKKIMSISFRNKENLTQDSKINDEKNISIILDDINKQVYFIYSLFS